MPKKYIVFLKTVGRSWFLILVVVILIVAIYNLLAAIIITIITIILFALSYIPSLFFKNRLLKFLKKYYRIQESDIIKDFSKDNKKVRDILFELSQTQDKKDWLIILLNGSYIFYHNDLVVKYTELYQKGLGEKEIFETLKKVDIETRAEIKKIEETLKRNNRLKKEKD
ncbi:MAG: hypothetical protein GF317_06690 [Candidatus Lokiarchaeota archaeon]|nr:hypothetical protein [Candidatus Lokiarchaeota archaeon]MBD3199402.1 hypothetical protein [Candidatus Lokiarchaeota archaeon]